MVFSSSRVRAQGHGRQHVDFHQGLPPSIVGAQGAVALPVWGEAGEKRCWEDGGLIFAQVSMSKGFLEAFLPEIGVMRW